MPPLERTPLFVQAARIRYFTIVGTYKLHSDVRKFLEIDAYRQKGEVIHHLLEPLNNIPILPPEDVKISSSKFSQMILKIVVVVVNGKLCSFR